MNAIYLQAYSLSKNIQRLLEMYKITEKYIHFFECTHTLDVLYIIQKSLASTRRGGKEEDQTANLRRKFSFIQRTSNVKISCFEIIIDYFYLYIHIYVYVYMYVCICVYICMYVCKT